MNALETCHNNFDCLFITLISFIFVFLSLYFYFILGALNLIYGSFRLFIYALLDHVDGEIAWLKGHASFKGRLFENYVGVVKDGFIILALTHNLFNQTGSVNSWYLGFFIMSLIYINSCLVAEVRIENLSNKETNSVINREVNSKIFWSCKRSAINRW